MWYGSGVPKPKAKHSGPWIPRDQRRAPCLSVTFSAEALEHVEALIADGYVDAREGRSGVVRAAIRDAFRDRFGDVTPAEVLKRKKR